MRSTVPARGARAREPAAVLDLKVFVAMQRLVALDEIPCKSVAQHGEAVVKDDLAKAFCPVARASRTGHTRANAY